MRIGPDGEAYRVIVGGYVGTLRFADGKACFEYRPVQMSNATLESALVLSRVVVRPLSAISLPLTTTIRCVDWCVAPHQSN